MWSLTVRRGFRWGCFLSVPNVFPSSSQSVLSMYPKFSIVFRSSSQGVPRKFPKFSIVFWSSSQSVPIMFPKCSSPHFLIATFIPYKCSLCRVGTSVNTFEGTTNFFLPNPIFWNLGLEQNPLKKIQYLPHLSSENCEINSIKSHSPRPFQQNQEQQYPPPPNSVFSFHFIWFSVKKWFNNQY
jgi:hypothetical protein